MKWYHGTDLESRESIFEVGFIPCFGRFGDGSYFSDDRTEAEYFGETVITIDTTENNTIEEIYYPDLIKLYPDLSIDEEEGVTDLENYIVNKLGKDGVIITYASGEKELCIYNTEIINFYIPSFI